MLLGERERVSHDSQGGGGFDGARFLVTRCDSLNASHVHKNSRTPKVAETMRGGYFQ